MIAVPMTGQPNGQNGPLSQQAGEGVGSPTASAPGGTPKNMTQAAAPNTFAAMQQQGMARPSPQMVQGQFRRSANVEAIGAPLFQQVMALLNDPTQGLNDAAQSNFDRNNRVLGREFTSLRQNLNENMAARGLDASTIAATKLGDLGARQAEAQADLAARIQEKLITDRAAAMNSAIQAAMGFRGQEFDMDSQEFSLNRGAMEADRNYALDMQRFGLDAELGRGNLALGQGRLALDGELGRGNLALGQQRLGFDMNRDARDFQYQQGRDASNDAFRNRDFEWRQNVDNRDFGYRQERDRVGDSQWDRQFTFNQNRDQRDFDYRSNRDTIGDQQWQSQFDRQNSWRQDDMAYRDRRDTIGDQRFTDSWNRDETRWNQQRTDTQQQNRDAMLLSILNGMGFNSLGPDTLNGLLGRLGITMPQPSPRNPGGGGVGVNPLTFY